MDRAEALTVVDRALSKLPELRRVRCGSPVHVSWVQTTSMDLARAFGSDSAVCLNFTKTTYHARGSFLISMLDYEHEVAQHNHAAYLEGLDWAEGILLSAKDQLATYGVDKMLRRGRVQSEGAKVFISHGTEGLALTKIERFLRALGVQPVIVGREASRGMSVDDLVEANMADADCVIILATADERVGDRMQPRPNVIHEIGLAQEKHGERVIYLKQQGCEFPSNIKPKVWGDFACENMESAFEKVSKELNAMGLL